jgi:hypothetical protein
MSVSPLSDVKAALSAKNNHTGPEIRDTLYDTTPLTLLGRTAARGETRTSIY